MSAPLDLAAVLAKVQMALNANEHDNPADTHLYDAIAMLKPHVPKESDPWMEGFMVRLNNAVLQRNIPEGKIGYDELIEYVAAGRRKAK